MECFEQKVVTELVLLKKRLAKERKNIKRKMQIGGDKIQVHKNANLRESVMAGIAI